MKFLNPIGCVGDEELTHRPAFVSVEVDCFTPLGRMFLAEVAFGKPCEVVSVWSHMVVNDVQEHAKALGMGFIDESAKVVRRAVIAGWSEHIHSVVTPPECARKIGNGHHLNDCDT